MSNALEVSEKEAAAVAKSANRVSLQDIEAKIAGEYIFTADQVFPHQEAHKAQLKILTICILVMDSGFTFIGKSAPVEPANFNADFGKRLAREDALRQVWPMEGYLLRNKLTNQG
jgi:hypothetical protein